MTPNEALEIITNAVQTDKMMAEQDEISEWGEENCDFDFDEEGWE